MKKPVIKCVNITFKYPDGAGALNGITFDVIRGESVGIAGANGAGKSTLLSLLSGLIMPSGGEIYLDETLITAKNLKLLRQRTGFVFQDPDDQLFTSSVYEDVAFGPRNLKLGKIEVEARVKEALERTGILHLSDRPPYRLSGGEKKSASIATILSMKPDVIIMDEPSSSLDPGARRKLIGLLNGFDHTKIITSHDLDFLMDTCSRIIIIDRGVLAADGTPEIILMDEPLLNRCGLELPLSLQKCGVCQGNGKK
jgi:cobalt/nickel transport system ATP-binding protein